MASMVWRGELANARPPSKGRGVVTTLNDTDIRRLVDFD